MKKEIKISEVFSPDVEYLSDEQLQKLRGGVEDFNDDCDSCQIGCKPGGQACGSCQPGNKKPK